MSIFGTTFDRSNSTPIVKAIKAIRKDALVLDYRRDEDAFKALWALNDDNVPTGKAGKELLAELAVGNKTIILIDADELLEPLGDDELPEIPLCKLSPVIPSDKFGKHLSALSWALCITHRLWQDKKRAPELDAPNIVILDMRSNAQHDATVIDFFDLPSTRKPSNIRWFKASLAGFDDLVTHLTAMPAEGNSAPRDIATFAKRWKSALVEADTRSSHHDLNNAMGPLSLAASIADASLSKQVIDIASKDDEKRSRAAMLRAMQWVVKTEANSSTFKPVHLENERELRILLLDDQAEDGWLPVLSHYLGLGVRPDSEKVQTSTQSGFRKYASSSSQDVPPMSLWYVTSPDSMVSLLGEKAESAKQTVTRVQFTNDVPSGNDRGFDEMLLLDLRLFGGDDTERGNLEKKYLEKVANSLQMATGGKPGWADQIREDGFRETPEYLQALTGLSQLISAVDFSYPIVVWSSTGQRKVMECLRDFRNIFTGLEKPRFDAYMSNADDLRITLDEAFQWAGKQLRAVSLFHELMALKDIKSWEPPGATHPYAEVYIEEVGDSYAEPFIEDVGVDTSGNGEFKVGSLIAFYKNEDTANLLHSQLGEAHFGGSVIQHNGRNQGSFPDKRISKISSVNTTLAFTGKGRLPKKLEFGNGGYLQDTDGTSIADPRTSIARKLAEQLEANGIQCMMLTSCLSVSMARRDIDPRYFLLLGDVLRTAFTLFLRGKSVRVFIATKQGVAQETNGLAAEEIARSHFEKWGILSEVEGNKIKFSSINNHSALHAVIDAHSHTDGIPGQAELCGARGVTLSYKQPAPRPAHYEWQIFKNFIVNGRDSGKGLQGCDEYGALAASFPHVQITDKANSWRHLHYYADEMLDSEVEYTKANVVAQDAWFDRSLSSVDPNKDSQLLILSSARSTLQGELTDAIERYAAAIFASPQQEEDGNIKLRNFVGWLLAKALASKPGDTKAAYDALLVTVNARGTQSESGQDKHECTKPENPAPLGKNELRIIHKNSTGEDGESYAVLALDDGLPCALLSKADDRVADCEVGQVVVVEKMASSCHAKVVQSVKKLCILEFAGLGNPT